MSDAKRYQVLAVCTHPASAVLYRTENVESCDGEYVLYSDYAALKAKADRLAEAAKHFCKEMTMRRVAGLQDALAAYQAGTGAVDAPSSEDGKQVDAKETKP